VLKYQCLYHTSSSNLARPHRLDSRSIDVAEMAEVDQSPQKYSTLAWEIYDQSRHQGDVRLLGHAA
jgi:hypothetical protein